MRLSCVDLLPHSYDPIISQKLTEILDTHTKLRNVSIYLRVIIEVNTYTNRVIFSPF